MKVTSSTWELISKRHQLGTKQPYCCPSLNFSPPMNFLLFLLIIFKIFYKILSSCLINFVSLPFMCLSFNWCEKAWPILKVTKCKMSTMCNKFHNQARQKEVCWTEQIEKEQHLNYGNSGNRHSPGILCIALCFSSHSVLHKVSE